MSEQPDEENMPPMDFGPGGVFITNGEEMTIKIAGLSEVQSARVFALQQARGILTPDVQTDTVQVGSCQRQWRKPGPVADVLDIYNLAVFILDGVDPWTEIRLAQPTPFRVAAVADEGGPDEELPPSD
jgi:hypothetical protein